MSALESDLVVLDSRQRTSGTIQDARYNLVDMGGVKGTYEIFDYHSNNGVYNVEAGVNDTVYWAEPGNLNATIPPGSYNQTTLNAAAKVVMDLASGSTFIFTVDADTGLVDVAIAAGTFNWEWGTNVALGDLANDLFGLLPVDTADDTNLEGTLVPNLILHTHLFITIPQEGTKAVTIMDGTEFSGVIPLNSAFGSPIEFEKGGTYSQSVSFGPSNITIIDVELYTEDGVAVSNLQEYVFMLRKLFD